MVVPAGADWRHPYGPGSNINVHDDHPVVHVCFSTRAPMRHWAGKDLPTEAEWEFAARAGRCRGIRLGRRTDAGRRANGQYLAGQFPCPESVRGWVRAYLAGDGLPAKRLRPPRHDRQCLGMDVGLVVGQARGRRSEGVVHSAQSAWRSRGGSYDPCQTQHPHPAQSLEGRLASLRAQLLPPLSSRGEARRAGRYLNQPCRLPLRDADAFSSFTANKKDLLQHSNTGSIAMSSELEKEQQPVRG